MINKTAPAYNTRSRTQKSETPPAIRTRSCTWLTRMENKTRKGQPSTVETTIAQLENDIHQALVVINTDNRKLLNCGELMRNQKYKKNWSTSSENEFGRLANGVSGHIKNQLTQSCASNESTYHTIKEQIWRTDNSYEVFDQRKRKEQNEIHSWLRQNRLPR